MGTDSDIPISELQQLLARAMEENIRILQALAENDRRSSSRPREAGRFVLDPRKEFKATVGSVSGFIQVTIPNLNLPTSEFIRIPTVESESVST